jgi:flagellar motor switch protein FliN
MSDSSQEISPQQQSPEPEPVATADSPTPADDQQPDDALENQQESGDINPPQEQDLSADSGFNLSDFTSATESAASTEEAQRLQRILRLEVPVIVKVAEKHLPLGDVINLSPGSIIEFSRSSDQPLQLQVNNKIIGQGSAVKVGEKFGLRINRISPVAETIRSLGS